MGSVQVFFKIFLSEKKVYIFVKNKKEFIAIEEIKEYKRFAFRGDIIKMSIAFILGASINNVVGSVSNHLVKPIINFILIKPNSLWSNFDIHLDKGIKVELGDFFSNFFEFLVTSIILYIIYVKLLGKVINIKESTKCCEFCMSEISKYAKKCPKCTSVLTPR